MAFIGVSITKKSAFRDATQEFSNTYHYSYTGLNPSESFASDIIDRLVVLEKTFHSNQVSFITGRLWSAGGTPAENQMILTKTLSGVGSVANDANLDRERAVLVQWPAGVDSRGHPVSLRKWFHPCGGFLGSFFSDAVKANLNAIPTVTRGQIETAVAPLHPLVAASVSMDLKAESGRGVVSAVKCHPYLEHHQLGDQWRG